MSFGCGTAWPMLEVLAERVTQAPNSEPRLILIDQDPVALAAATLLAEDLGVENLVEAHCKRLFDRWVDHWM